MLRRRSRKVDALEASFMIREPTFFQPLKR